MITIEALKNAGADVETGLARCMNKEDFYLKLIYMGLNDAHFEQLGIALSNKDLDKAFEHCHALKGVIGNLAIDPLFNAISELTELLRNKSADDYNPLYQKILEIRSRLIKL